MYEKIFEAFPKRPMKVKKHGAGHPIAGFLCILIGLVVIWMVSASTLPGILRDWEIDKDPIGATNVSMSNGKCTTHTILVSCEATLRYRGGRAKPKSQEQLRL